MTNGMTAEKVNYKKEISKVVLMLFSGSLNEIIKCPSLFRICIMDWDIEIMEYMLCFFFDFFKKLDCITKKKELKKNSLKMKL